MGVRDIFQGGGSGGSSIWVGDVCDDPPHGLGTGGISIKVWPIGSQKDIRGGFWMEFESTPFWRRWCRRECERWVGLWGISEQGGP